MSIVLYWFEAAPPAAADKGFARFRSYVPLPIDSQSTILQSRWCGEDSRCLLMARMMDQTEQSAEGMAVFWSNS